MNRNGEPLRLLSLDGGGIRGLSSLYILKSIMITIQDKKALKVKGPLYPCDYFDLIGGTSTGGLIAIMLGVLRMDIDSCIEKYIELAPEIFPVEGIISASGMGKALTVLSGQQRFKPAPFEAAIKKLIAYQLRGRSGEGENTALKFESAMEQKCRVFVCVTSEKLSKHFRFRSYDRQGIIDEDCAIWQACRATSAAPTFFPPIEIGKPPIAFVDGGLGYNNPIRALTDEVSNLWPNEKIGCIVSVGTGVPASKDIGRRIKPLFETLKSMALDTEKVAREFENDMRSRHEGENTYFRFNVPSGLEQIGLEEWKHLDTVKVATLDYLNEQWSKVDMCASQIHSTCILTTNSTRITPSSTVPFPQDSNFIKRDDIILKLDSLLKPSATHRGAALFGLGGIGKSQIAIEYSYIIRERAPNTWVFWVHASNATRFEQGFRAIATKVGIPGHNDPKINILPLVQEWLDQKQHGPWLMILDNVDDSEFLFQPWSSRSHDDTIKSDQPLREFIPQKPHGALFVTSRNRTAAYDMIGDYDKLVELNQMNEVESLSLLKTRVSISPLAEDDAAHLLDALGHIPLAITQAGAYIRQCEPIMTITNYLTEFRKNEINQAKLLNKGSKDLRRDSSVPNAIITTWEISFDQIRRTNQPAADLLSLMSLFHRQNIPNFLLQADEDYVTFADTVDPLVNFSLVRVDSGGKLFDMHRLVQIATRKWLEVNDLLQKWKIKAVQRMAENFPVGKYENWEKCNLLLSHAENVLSYEQTEDESRLDRASVLHNMAWYIQLRGNYELAALRSEESLDIRRQLLDPDNHQVLCSMNNVSNIYRDQGRWKEAEELQLQVMETNSSLLGKEHPNTLTSMGNLALTFDNQGRWKEAEKLELQIIKTESILFGKEHPDTLTSMNNLAVTLSNQERWKEAEELQLQIMKTRLNLLGKEHPDTLTSMGNLASTFLKQGRWKEAEELQLQVMKTSSSLLGKEHPQTLISMGILAMTFGNQGRWKEAEELQLQVMKTDSILLGKKHPNTLRSMNNLAITFWNQKRWKEAEELQLQVMKTSSSLLGKEHPNTLKSMGNLAFTYNDQGRNEEAIELLKEVVELEVKVLGADHPHTISSKDDLNEWTSKMISDSED